MVRMRCYIGGRNTGKTTILKRLFRKLHRLQKKLAIFVLDSAIQEGNKSLIKQLQAEGYWGALFEFKCAADFANFEKNAFKSSVVFCDVSYYLEKGHEAETGAEKEKLRNQYKETAADILEYILEHNWREMKPIIIMDEIEINDRAAKIILKYLNTAIIRMAIHNINFAPPQLLAHANIKIVNLIHKYHQ